MNLLNITGTPAAVHPLTPRTLPADDYYWHHIATVALPAAARAYDRPITRGTRVVYPALSRQVATVMRVIRLRDGSHLLNLCYDPPLRWKDGQTQAHADARASEVVIVEGATR